MYTCMYTHVHVHVHVHTQCTHMYSTHIHVHTQSTHIYNYMYMYHVITIVTFDVAHNLLLNFTVYTINY